MMFVLKKDLSISFSSISKLHFLIGVLSPIFFVDPYDSGETYTY